MKCGDPNNPAGPYIRDCGLPCKRDVRVGANRCNLHDARGPVSKLAAERALALARLPGCEALFTLIDQWAQDTCTTCGFPSADPHIVRNILRAIQLVLDRTGMPPVMKVENVPQSDGDLILDHLTPGELEQVARVMAEFKALKAEIRARRMQPADGKQIPTNLSERIM